MDDELELIMVRPLPPDDVELVWQAPRWVAHCAPMPERFARSQANPTYTGYYDWRLCLNDLPLGETKTTKENQAEFAPLAKSVKGRLTVRVRYRSWQGNVSDYASSPYLPEAGK